MTRDETLALFPNIFATHPAGHEFLPENLNADEDFRQSLLDSFLAPCIDTSCEIPMPECEPITERRTCKSAYADDHSFTYRIYHDHERDMTFLNDNDDESPQNNYDYIVFPGILDASALADISIHIDSLDPYLHMK